MAPRAHEKRHGGSWVLETLIGLMWALSPWRLVYVSKSDLHVKISTHGCGNPLLTAKFSVFYPPHAAD